MASAFIDQIAIVAFAALLGWAAVTDFRRYLIPNAISIALVALYPAHVLTSPTPVDWAGAIVVAAIVLVVGFVIFALRIAGGGDVKLLTAASLWAGPAQVLPFMFVTAITGGFLALMTFGYLRYLRPMPAPALAPDETAALKLRASVPYGIAIALGGFWLAVRMLAG